MANILTTIDALAENIRDMGKLNERMTPGIAEEICGVLRGIRNQAEADLERLEFAIALQHCNELRHRIDQCGDQIVTLDHVKDGRVALFPIAARPRPRQFGGAA